MGRGFRPVWRQDGKEIFYTDNSRILAVSVHFEEAGVRLSEPTVVAEGLGGPGVGFSVSNDGQRILLPEPIAGTGDARQVSLVLNWGASIRYRIERH